MVWSTSSVIWATDRETRQPGVGEPAAERPAAHAVRSASEAGTSNGGPGALLQLRPRDLHPSPRLGARAARARPRAQPALHRSTGTPNTARGLLVSLAAQVAKHDRRAMPLGKLLDFFMNRGVESAPARRARRGSHTQARRRLPFDLPALPGPRPPARASPRAYATECSHGPIDPRTQSERWPCGSGPETSPETHPRHHPGRARPNGRRATPSGRAARPAP